MTEIEKLKAENKALRDQIKRLLAEDDQISDAVRSKMPYVMNDDCPSCSQCNLCRRRAYPIRFSES